jgi:hypothetical protein
MTFKSRGSLLLILLLLTRIQLERRDLKSAKMTTEKAKATRKKKAAILEAWRTRPLGYPRLSERMGVKPETLIFRKFSALNARILLYMQAELIILEKQLQKQEERDISDEEGKRCRYASDYHYLLLSHKDGDTSQLELVRKIQGKLEVYSELPAMMPSRETKLMKHQDKTLLKQHRLHQIPGPDRFDLEDVQALLYSDAMGPGTLTGEDGTVWGHPDTPRVHSPNLIGVCPREDVDTFSRIISQNAIHLFRCGLARLKRADPHLGKHVYYDRTVMLLTKWMTSILASLLPVASILVLVKLQSQEAKLWTVAAFNVLLTICLTMTTKAKRAEVFAITAA